MKVIVENNDFGKYENFLSHYREWLENSRDIKLLFLLQPESKLEFNIVFEKYTSIYIYSKNGLNYSHTPEKEVGGFKYHPLVSIKEIKFILKNNKILDMEIKTSDEEKIGEKNVHVILNEASYYGNTLIFLTKD